MHVCLTLLYHVRAFVVLKHRSVAIIAQPVPVTPLLAPNAAPSATTAITPLMQLCFARQPTSPWQRVAPVAQQAITRPAA